MPALATISATRAVRSIISRLVFVRMWSSVSITFPRPGAGRDRLHARPGGFLGGDADGHPPLVRERRLERIPVYPARLPGALDRRAGLLEERRRVAVDVPVRL